MLSRMSSQTLRKVYESSLGIDFKSRPNPKSLDMGDELGQRAIGFDLLK